MPFNKETAKQAREKARPRGEAKLTKLIRDAADKDKAIEVFGKLETQALDGDLDAIRLYLSYIIGKPKESVDITTDGDKITGFTVEVLRRESKNTN